MAEKEKKIVDYKNPGLDNEGGKNLKFISENSEFLNLKRESENKFGVDGSDIFRLAVSIAIARDLTLPNSIGQTGRDEEKRPHAMSWTQGTLDKPTSAPNNKNPRSLVDLVKTLCDHPLAQEAPWAYIQLLAHAGLEELVKDIKAKKMISEII